MTTINKQISLGTDDCTEQDDATVNLTYTIVSVGHTLHVIDAGLRWQSINILQGSSITSAKLSLFFGGDTGTLSANIRGIDEDNTATWSAGSRPSQRTKTTATITANKANWNNWVLYNWSDIDITSVIQEIVNRSGWSSGNALAVVMENTGASGNYIDIRMYEYATNLYGAKLDIVYVATSAIPVIVHQLQQQGIS